MSEYNPDKWIILKITGEKGEVLLKVLAGWSGSYLEGQSWKVNSGISKCKVDGNYFMLSGYSGSVYKCHKKAYGTNMIMCGIISQLEDVPNVQVLSEEDALKEIEAIP